MEERDTYIIEENVLVRLYITIYMSSTVLYTSKKLLAHNWLIGGCYHNKYDYFVTLLSCSIWKTIQTETFLPPNLGRGPSI